jgi:hypothetical protein
MRLIQIFVRFPEQQRMESWDVSRKPKQRLPSKPAFPWSGCAPHTHMFHAPRQRPFMPRGLHRGGHIQPREAFPRRILLGRGKCHLPGPTGIRSATPPHAFGFHQRRVTPATGRPCYHRCLGSACRRRTAHPVNSVTAIALIHGTDRRTRGETRNAGGHHTSALGCCHKDFHVNRVASGVQLHTGDIRHRAKTWTRIGFRQHRAIRRSEDMALSSS